MDISGLGDKNLQIDLVKDTSILNITYRDTDPELVLPVIERISRDYQRYSGSERKRGLDQGVDYLKKQVAELNEQSQISMRKAQTYALNNGLGLQDGMPTVATGQGQELLSKPAAKQPKTASMT